MTSTGAEPAAAEFEAHRPRLRSIAYAILGSAADADDAVQEAWLRWQRQPPGAVRDPHAWFTTVVSRIAVDMLTSARRRREEYVGTWLPEPLVAPADGPCTAAEIADDVEMALLVVLETVPPAERAAFVLCEVFGYPATEAARALGKSPAAVRQLTSRARRRVQDARPLRTVDDATRRAVVASFMAACEGRSLDGLMDVLAPDVEFSSDGGGKVSATRAPVRGRERVAAALLGFIDVVARHGDVVESAHATVNGHPGLLVRVGTELSVYSFVVEGTTIAAMHVVRNPDKLRGVSATAESLLGPTQHA